MAFEDEVRAQIQESEDRARIQTEKAAAEALIVEERDRRLEEEAQARWLPIAKEVVSMLVKFDIPSEQVWRSDVVGTDTIARAQEGLWSHGLPPERRTVNVIDYTPVNQAWILSLQYEGTITGDEMFSTDAPSIAIDEDANAFPFTREARYNSNVEVVKRSPQNERRVGLFYANMLAPFYPATKILKHYDSGLIHTAVASLIKKSTETS